MSDAKLMLPLFYNGMFNRDGRKIRAVHNYDVSNGEYSYRLWTQAGQPDMDYPRSESDRYLLYVEIQGYLVPLGMTEYRLTERCGYLPAMQELYGGVKNRSAYFNSLQKNGVGEAIEREESVIYHLGKNRPCKRTIFAAFSMSTFSNMPPAKKAVEKPSRIISAH